ncbi:hypothetical protein Pint_22250 [Pistacia integerrima]|uniref:Uncharacterized protein n=1 Tax=Pistacia integerrima TaxID=434235 RepID=A0ACC0YIW7_9ROSI|nr:hypothetical protein Pint_22250 [Pistacia integerrima]
MAIQSSSFSLRKPVRLAKIFIFLAVFGSQVNGLTARKLEESSTGGDQSIKCQPSCIQSPPPPSPPSPPPPSPPPPELPPPPPSPPPTPKKPSTQYCPPPPSFIYMTGPPGPPGNLYPIDSDFSGSRKASAANLPILFGSGLLLLLAFW